jgi:hypothetical protein
MTIQENRQQLFEKMVTGLYLQGERSVDITSCKYRFGCLKCAIGHLIPDELYDPKMEIDMGLKTLVQVFPDILIFLDNDTHDKGLITFLTDAQRDLHDWLSVEPKYFKEFLLNRVKEFAKAYKLETNFIEKLEQNS